MEDKCVVGNCTNEYDEVRRCYWSKEVGLSRGTLEDHGYLDLCSFHQGLFESHTCAAWRPGWDAV
jgi:hypothetical protein